MESPTPFEPAALLGALNIIEAIRVRLELKGIQVSYGALIDIANYEIGVAVQKAEAREQSKMRNRIRNRAAYHARKKSDADPAA